MSELGLRKLRPGFARTPALDRAFALGWPETYFVGDAAGIPVEAAGRRWIWTREDAEARVRARLAAADLRAGEGALGRETALRFARHVIPFGWSGTLDDAVL